MPEFIANPTAAQHRYNLLASLFLALLVLLALLPRSLAIAPGLLGLLLCAAGWFLLRERPAFGKTIALCCAGVTALAGGSALWSADPGFAVERTLKIALVLGPGLLLVAAMTQIRALPPFLRALPALALAGAAVGAAAELALDFPLYRLLRGEAPDILVPPAQMNRTLTVMVMALPLCAGLLATMENGRKYAAMLALCVAPALLLGESQSAQLAFLVALGALFFPLSCRAAWVALFAAIAAAIIAAPFVMPWAFTHLAPLLADSAMTGTGGAYAPHRLEIWSAVSALIMQKPLLGHGVEALRHMDDIGMAHLYHQGGSALHPHNFALQFWLEFGAAGAAAIIALCGLTLRALYRRRALAETRFALAAFAATLSVASMSYGIWQGWFVGLVMMLVAMAALPGPELKDKAQN